MAKYPGYEDCADCKTPNECMGWQACLQIFPEYMGALHASDCAVNSEPAYAAGPCDCGAIGSPDPKL